MTDLPLYISYERIFVSLEINFYKRFNLLYGFMKGKFLTYLNRSPVDEDINSSLSCPVVNSGGSCGIEWNLTL